MNGVTEQKTRGAGALEGFLKVLTILYILQGILFAVPVLVAVLVALNEPQQMLTLQLMILMTVAVVVYVFFGVSLWRESPWIDGIFGHLVAISNILIWLSPIVGFWREFQILWALQGAITIWALVVRRRAARRHC
jgi:hypothetical protein